MKRKMILLPRDLAEFVDGEIASGRYRSQNEMLCTGLRLLQKSRRAAELNAQIQQGIDELQRGDTFEFDSESLPHFFDEMKAEGRRLAIEPDCALKLAALRNEIQVGLDQLDRGEGKQFDAAEIESAIRQRLADE
jgi:putative addiction module CopG family antidote